MIGRKRHADDGDAEDCKQETSKLKTNEPSRIIYHYHEYPDRIIFAPPLSDHTSLIPSTHSLVKVERCDTTKKVTAEDRVRNRISDLKLDPSGERFVFWEDTLPEHLVDASQLKQLFPKITQAWKPGSFQLRTARNAGFDLDRLLRYDEVKMCPSCEALVIDANTQPERMYMSAEYALKFLEYLLSSLILLSDNGIQHDDLRLANFVVSPSESELKDKILRTSLPRMIDFGISIIYDDLDKAKRFNTIDLMGMFVACIHGLRRLERKMNENDEVDEVHWFAMAVLPEERASIQEVLDMFNSFPLHTDKMVVVEPSLVELLNFVKKEMAAKH